MNDVFWIGGETLHYGAEQDQGPLSSLFRRCLGKTGVNPAWVDEFHLFLGVEEKSDEDLFPSAAVHIWPSESFSAVWLFQSFCRTVILGSSHLLAAGEIAKKGQAALLLASSRLLGMYNLIPEGSLGGFFSAGGQEFDERQKLNTIFNKLKQNGFELDGFKKLRGSSFSPENNGLLTEGFGERYFPSDSSGIITQVNSLSTELAAGETGLVLQYTGGNVFSLVFEKI